MAESKEADIPVESSCYADPNFAVICGFFDKFGKMCGIPFPSAGELVAWLECEEEVPVGLASLHTQLLRKIRRSTTVEKWERTAVKFCQVYLNDDADDLDSLGYLGCPMDLKLRLLRTLLETQFDQNPKFKSAVNLLTAEELRSKPLGKDMSGRRYWLHLDSNANLKVYCEDPEEDGGGWHIVAHNRVTLVKLIHQLSGDCTLDLSPINEPPAPVRDTGQDSSDDGQGDEENGELSEGTSEGDDEEPEVALSEGATEADDDESEKSGEKGNTGDKNGQRKRKADEEDDLTIKKARVSPPNEELEDTPFECSEAIEEDVMHFTGEGSGAECDAVNPEKSGQVNCDQESDIVGTSNSGLPPESTPEISTDSSGLAPSKDELTEQSTSKSVEAQITDETSLDRENLVANKTTGNEVSCAITNTSGDADKPKVWSIDDICPSNQETEKTPESPGHYSSFSINSVLESIPKSSPTEIQGDGDLLFNSSNLIKSPMPDITAPDNSGYNGDEQIAKKSTAIDENSPTVENPEPPTSAVLQSVSQPPLDEPGKSLEGEEQEEELPKPEEMPLIPSIIVDREISQNAETSNLENVTDALTVPDIIITPNTPESAITHSPSPETKSLSNCETSSPKKFVESEQSDSVENHSLSTKEMGAIQVADLDEKDLKTADEPSENFEGCKQRNKDASNECPISNSTKEEIKDETTEVISETNQEKEAPSVSEIQPSTEDLEKSTESTEKSTEVVRRNSETDVSHEEVEVHSELQKEPRNTVSENSNTNSETLEEEHLKDEKEKIGEAEPLELCDTGPSVKLIGESEESPALVSEEINPEKCEPLVVERSIEESPASIDQEPANLLEIGGKISVEEEQNSYLSNEQAISKISQKMGLNFAGMSERSDSCALSNLGKLETMVDFFKKDNPILPEGEVDSSSKTVLSENSSETGDRSQDEKELIEFCDNEEMAENEDASASADLEPVKDEKIETKEAEASVEVDAQNDGKISVSDDSEEKEAKKTPEMQTSSEDANDNEKPDEVKQEDTEISEVAETTAEINNEKESITEDKSINQSENVGEEGLEGEEISTMEEDLPTPEILKNNAEKSEEETNHEKDELKADPLDMQDPLADEKPDVDPLAVDTTAEKKKKSSVKSFKNSDDEEEKESPKKKRKKKTELVRIAHEAEQLGIAIPEVEDVPPGVRQSRRIAVLKMREAEERRRREEIELEAFKKKKHKEKNKSKKKASGDEDYVDGEDEDDDDDDESEKKAKKEKKFKFDPKNAWMTSSDDSDGDGDEEVEDEEIEDEHEEIDEKSDHEFSPESDLDDPDYKPVRVVRTAHARKEAPGKYDDVKCEVCGESDKPEWILLCDGCDKGTHTHCLKPPLHLVPDGEWFCPPCSLQSLLVELKKALRAFDRCEKQRENEELRKRRLAFVGISLDNVLPPSKKQKKTEKEKGSESGTESESSSSSGDSSDSGPVYQLRERRTKASNYRFNEYDELIRSAIQEEIGEPLEEPVADEEKVDDNEEAAECEVQLELKGPEEEQVEAAKKEEETYNAQTDEDEVPVVVPRKRKIKKRRKKLTSLEFSSEDEDDQNSDSDFKGTSEDEEDEDFELEDVSEDSELSDAPRGRKGKTWASTRAMRAKNRRLDREFINDQTTTESDDDSDRREWESSDESSESDRSWGRRKRKKKGSPPRKKKKSTTKRKQARSSDDSDSDPKPRKRKKKTKYAVETVQESEVTNRRTRGKKINFVINQDDDATDSEVERRKRKIRTGRVGRFASEESDEDFKADEEKLLEDGDEENDDVFDSEDASEAEARRKKAQAKKQPPKGSVKKNATAKKTRRDSDDSEASDDLEDRKLKKDVKFDDKAALKKTKDPVTEAAPAAPVVKRKGCKVKITPTRAEIAERAAAAKAKKAAEGGLLKKSLEATKTGQTGIPSPLQNVNQQTPGLLGVPIHSSVTGSGPPPILQNIGPMLTQMGPRGPVMGHPSMGQVPPLAGPGPPMPAHSVPSAPYPPTITRMPMGSHLGLHGPPGPIQGSPIVIPTHLTGQHPQMMAAMPRGPVPSMSPQPITVVPNLPPAVRPIMVNNAATPGIPIGAQYPPTNQTQFPAQASYPPESSPNFSDSGEPKQRRKPGPKPGSKNKKKTDVEESPEKGKPRTRKPDGEVTIATVQAPTQFPDTTGGEEGSVITRMLNSTQGAPATDAGPPFRGSPGPPIYHPPRSIDPSPSGGGAVAVGKAPFPPEQFANFQNFPQQHFPGFSEGSFPSEQPPGPTLSLNTPLLVPPNKNFEEEGSEFGGLASYFASQAEEEMDA